MPKAKNPLYVVVANGRYDMVGKPTLKNKCLAQVLKNIGGVSDVVADGTYIFGVKGVTKHGRIKVFLDDVEN